MTREGRGLRRWTLVRAPSVAVPDSVRRAATQAEPATASARLFTERARQHRRHRAAPWLAALAGAVVLGILAVVVYATPVLGVRRLDVRGNAIVSDDQVRAAAAVPDGAPLASLDLGAIGRRVGALAAVRQVRVGRAWPSTVVVTVTERSPVAALPAAGGGFQLIDPTGVVFRTVPARPAGLALLVLVSPGPDDPGTRAGLSVLAALTGELRGALVRLVVAAPTRITLELAGDRTVIWGDATDNEAKATVATALLARPGRTIDVSAPSVVTVN
jgi:cell division protein FtsQ